MGLDLGLSHEAVGVLILHVVDLVIPGPVFALIVRNSLLSSRQNGIASALGAAVTESVHITYTMLGMGALVIAYPWVRVVTTTVGSGYLLYLGYQSLRVSRPTGVETSSELTSNLGLSLSLKRAFGQGLLVNLFNVRIALFYVILVSPIITPETSMLARWLWSWWFIGTTAVWFIAIAWLFSREKLRQIFTNYSHYVEWGGGIIFILCGMGMALSIWVS